MTNPLFERGLLEQPLLRICSDELRDDAGAPVGLVRPHRPSPGWGWWFPTVWTIHEWEQEPLVFSLYRAWTLVPRWEVLDAENRLVGWVSRRAAFDPAEELLFRFDRPPALRGGYGFPLGAFAEDVLRFDPLTSNQPFLRMLLLAWALCQSDQRIGTR
jgi:hypothetical protein